MSLVTPNGKNTKWRRIERNGVQEWLDENPGALSYFSTIQSFSKSVKTEGEDHWSPLFFDLDSEDRNIAFSDLRKIVDYFTEGFEIVPEVFFSGNKGFHIIVPGEFYGAIPDSKLTYHWKHLANQISKTLDVVTHDRRVYSIPRMWRVTNTIHKSGLYKVPIRLTELERGLDYILDKAKEPRRIKIEPHTLSVMPVLVDLYKSAVSSYEEEVKGYETAPLEAPVFGMKHPLCVQYLLDYGLAVLGTKNRADMALANYCKASKMGIPDAENFMTSWSRSISPRLTNVYDSTARVMQSISVLRTVYSDPKYKFSCGSIRACEIDVDCKLCDVKKQSEIKTVRLTEFAKAENHGRRVCVEADIVGKNSSEMIIPRVIKGWCRYNPEAVACARCHMGKYYNTEAERMERTINLDASEPLIIQLADVSKTALAHRIKRVFGVEDRCYNFEYEVTWGNANVVYLATRISSEFKIEEQITRSKALYLDHAMELNQGYNLYGYVWSHPQNNNAMLVIDSAELMESSLRTFTLPEGRADEFKIFQPDNGQTALEKVKSIHKVFENNFVRVYGREELIMAVDLVYHSGRRFNFQHIKNVKGWLDILILGDTRQGKSETAEKLMEYYKLGVMAAGETSSRTGLLYAINMISGEEAWITFGLLCRANGYLVIVDEMHDMPTSDFKEFTQARSKGTVDVKRVAFGAAKAETRLISIANARPGKALASYSYPVMALPDIPCFRDLADVARFDYCVGVRAGDIDDDTINQDARKIQDLDNPYTPELCRDLILWIWTRTPDQIHITRDAEKVILQIAKDISKDFVPDIPLIEAADVRYKIARIAIAVAGRVYSSTDSETLRVLPEHAVAARTILEEFYKSPSLDYYGWSDDRKRIEISPERLNVLKLEFQGAFVSSWQSIAQWLLDVNTFSKQLLRTSCGLATGDLDPLMAFLITNRFILNDRHGYIKTPAGREFLHGMINAKRALPEKSTEPEVEEKDEVGDEF